MKAKSFTLTELIIVIVIVGILVALGLPSYNRIKEKSLDREAKASLALIRAAEKIYKMEQGWYYPRPVNTQTTASVINTFLKLNLPESALPAPLWAISVNSATERVLATRAGIGSATYPRVWTINFSGEADPTCAGTCP